MIALDTNVLVRFLTRDDDDQFARARRTIRSAVARSERLFISDVVLCETVWVLLSVYRVSRTQVGETVAEVLKAGHLAFRDVDVLSRALAAFVAGKGDFADYVIREDAWAAGCEAVATFDRDLLREDGFVAP